MPVPWDNAIITFLNDIGAIQALKGLELDILVMNPAWESDVVPAALNRLLKKISTPTEDFKPLEERKLDYVHTIIEPRSQSSVNKSISKFLAQTRARNDLSNRNEFVQSIAQKRRRLADEGNPAALLDDLPTCARTDALPIDRDSQIKYDIAKNEDGPLKRTVHAQEDGELGSPTTKGADFEERFQNIESHLAVRYVPVTPHSFTARLKLLEDHLIRLEKDYPPWAALHFNQPSRGWPPPPRSTPIIVPPQLRHAPSAPPLPSTSTSTSTSPHQSNPITSRSTSTPPTAASSSSSGPAATPNSNSNSTPSVAKGRQKQKSSLHRAVLERLEVQRAINEIEGKPQP